ncbi:MAG: hypothetical protein PHH33_00575 [Parabacteroides sp.]|nr:hypothetical protein [Parabacteroides sp.]
MTDIEQYINNKVVTSSGMVVEYCVQTYGITEINARKRIQRLPESIYKIKGICKDNQSILYHKDKWGDEEFYNGLVEILHENANQHYLIINGLWLHDGIILKEKLASFTASPILRKKGHKSFESVLSDLKSLRLVEESTTHYSLSGYANINEKRAKAVNMLQAITIAHFHEWARNIGLISYDSAKFDSEFSRYQFSMVAPSYIKSLTSKLSDKLIPAFVLADIILKQDITEMDVQFLIKKLQNISMQNQSAKFIPFLLVSSHNSDVYHALKSNGIVVGNIDELFGKKYSETILGILNLIENAGAVLKNNPDQYIKLIENIEKLAVGKTYNLKGDLFEMAVGLFHGQQCQSLEISKNIHYDYKHREIDVYAVYQDKVVFAECKGYNYPIDDGYIDEWLSTKIPVIRDWALSCESLKSKKIDFEIWCTGGFTEESITKLVAAKEKTKKYFIDFFDLNRMRSVARDKNINHFEKVIKTYYIKEV